MPEHGRAVLLADFNTAALAAALGADTSAPRLEAVSGPFGQTVAALETRELDCWKAPADVAVVWTRPESVNGAFAAALDGHPPDLPAMLEEVDAFAGRLAAARDRAGIVLAVAWALRPDDRAHGIHALRHGVGLGNLLLHMNLRLCEACQRRDVHVLDAQAWLRAAGDRAFSARMWSLAKIPFDHAVFRRAAADIKAAVRTLRGGTRKLLLLDLDNTLWGGTLGDVGTDGLRLGGHDRDGESFVEFQRAALALSRRGVLLGVVSKNDEARALDAMERHPEMALRPANLAAWRINWNDKAQNIVELCDDLQLGLSSVVFIDDHAAERARVREALPEVLVPDWPVRPECYTSALRALDCFDTADVSEEDRERTAQYVAERQRAGARRTTSSIEQWLLTLETRVLARPLAPIDCSRASQLMNRSNQMNLLTRRMSPGELSRWADDANRRMWTFRVSDRFGAAGLTGLASVELHDQVAELVDFVLSCRVMGRGIEDTMLHVVTDWAGRTGAREVVLRYRPTPKNGPCRRFLEGSHLDRSVDGEYRWTSAAAYPLPPGVALQTEAVS